MSLYSIVFLLNIKQGTHSSRSVCTGGQEVTKGLLPFPFLPHHWLLSLPSTSVPPQVKSKMIMLHIFPFASRRLLYFWPWPSGDKIPCLFCLTRGKSLKVGNSMGQAHDTGVNNHQAGSVSLSLLGKQSLHKPPAWCIKKCRECQSMTTIRSED